MSSAGYKMPIAISQFSKGVEESFEPQNKRAIQWLLRQPGGPITVVTPRKNVPSNAVKDLIAQANVIHCTWKGLSAQSLTGRVLLAWPSRKQLNDLWGIEADALVVIEWNTQATEEWIEDYKPLLLRHDGATHYAEKKTEKTQSKPLPQDVKEILEYIAKTASGYSTGLKWNEIEMLRADIMNHPQRWATISANQVRDMCRKLDMRPKDTDTITEILQRHENGDRFNVRSPYHDFYFEV